MSQFAREVTLPNCKQALEMLQTRNAASPKSTQACARRAIPELISRSSDIPPSQMILTRKQRDLFKPEYR